MTTVIVHTEYPDLHIDTLAPRHPGATFVPCDSYEGLAKALRQAKPDVVFSTRFASTPDYPAKALLGPDGPGWISVGGSGVDHLGHWDTAKVTVTNSAGVAAAMMAEYTFGCLLHFSLDIAGLEIDKSAKRWTNRTVTPLRGKTILIVGLGKTGQAVAAMAQSFGMTVLGTRARPQDMENVDHVHAADDLPGLWSKADAVVVCTPLLPSTRGLLGAAAFEAMTPGTLLVDVSRGGVIVQSALIDALRNGKIAGAGLDVFETEPLPAENPLWDMPNVVLSPHCSSVFDGWEADSILMFSDNLNRFINGQPLRNIVDPDRGY